MATRNFHVMTGGSGGAVVVRWDASLSDLNSIIYEGELAAVEEVLGFAAPHVDAVIIADWGVAAICRELGYLFIFLHRCRVRTLQRLFF